MNYEEFRVWRAALLRKRSPRRLDCMNPEMALAHLRPTLGPLEAATLDETVGRWSRAVGVSLRAERRVVGGGIRAILEGLFAVIAESVDTFWLPEDVYPVYWQLSSQLRRRAFRTLPELDWSFLSACGPRDALLLPHPLSPLGRPLAAEDLARLIDWLDGKPERLLVLDAAYSFGAPAEPLLRDLLEGDRTMALWSLSKPWLSRGMLGIASVPPAMKEQLQARVRVPDPSKVARASGLILSAPTLPRTLRDRFAAAWDRLSSTLVAASPEWMPPRTGYFSILPIHFEGLLSKHDLLAVPASVFGSTFDELSVVTCLYDIEIHDGRAT